MSDRTPHERKAYEMGRTHALNAASWIIDGGDSTEHYRRLLEMIEAGDPELYDFLPNSPNLSGEWADDLTPLRLVTEIAGDEIDPDPIIDALAEAFEAGVDETFMDECERLIRSALS